MATKQLRNNTLAKRTNQDPVLADKRTVELYQAFMDGYVRRINDATFKVTIGGVKIGSAKYTRLAQINLQTRVITFSRFAVENVPERGRRYLVLHELAHVKETNHNKRFWQLVETFEPNYRIINRELELAFQQNVTEDRKHLAAHNMRVTEIDNSRMLLKNRLSGPRVEITKTEQMIIQKPAPLDIEKLVDERWNDEDCCDWEDHAAFDLQDSADSTTYDD